MAIFGVSMSKTAPHEWNQSDKNGGYNIDRGGETKWGISKKAHPNLDIKNLTYEEAIEIYKKEYWAGIKGDELPQALADRLFDFAVNHGVHGAVETLQKTLNYVLPIKIKVDGIIGIATLACINSNTDKLQGILDMFTKKIKDCYASINDKACEKSWLRRADDYK